ncbi:MAG: hypothetical protein HY015_05750 [Bacteroidetes bacterium]|nr:hypothetical protein [Bacteroidota bacterium]MBI3482466.1 hypothetical protein [Bacteroidota bacterium]
MEYKLVEGKQLDARLLKIAEDSVRGAGDGRISKQDAEKILTLVVDGNIYSAVEHETLEHIHKNYHWTDAAWDWFNDQLKIWKTKFEKPIQMTPAEISKQHFSREDVLTNETDREVREHGLRSATNETYQDHDDITLIVRLADGKRVEVTSNFIELAGQFVELKGGYDIPVRAIEKVEI